MVQSLNVSGIVNAFRLLWNPSLAVPHLIVNDIRNINFEQLKRQGGIQAMGFDKDNCLTAPYVPHIHPPYQKAWAVCKETFGSDKVVIVSNSAGTPDDKDHVEAKKLQDALGVPVLRHEEKKPSGGAALASHLHPISADKIAFVGDRILTDVVFGNLNGNFTIWTSKIVTETGDNKAALIMRRFEHGIIRFLQSLHVKPPSHPVDQKASQFIKE
ncbi:HAD-superfamily phosphatase [Lichtheimia hyalospora FSU 10163]|nr:HAD-superfamily phosphatase [Lichtheimia hyalospora FSU 10163]